MVQGKGIYPFFAAKEFHFNCKMHDKAHTKHGREILWSLFHKSSQEFVMDIWLAG